MISWRKLPYNRYITLNDVKKFEERKNENIFKEEIKIMI